MKLFVQVTALIVLVAGLHFSVQASEMRLYVELPDRHWNNQYGYIILAGTLTQDGKIIVAAHPDDYKPWAGRLPADQFIDCTHQYSILSLIATKEDYKEFLSRQFGHEPKVQQAMLYDIMLQRLNNQRK